MSINEFLKDGFVAAAIDKNHTHNSALSPRLITNDKRTSKKVLSTIINELRTCEEFAFSVAFVTNSGVATLIQTLKELEEIGIKGRILVSKYQNFTEPMALQRLLYLKNIELRIAIQDRLNAEFHAKGYLFKKCDHWKFIVGSSNLTQNALSINKEWNLAISTREEGILSINILQEFDKEFKNAIPVNEDFIKIYKDEYFKTKLFTRSLQIKTYDGIVLQPNKMQKEALENLQLLRSKGKTKSLLVSATGTGKTFLSAFDARMFNPKKLLFIVHRANIAKKSLETFESIFKQSKTYGLYSGDTRDLNTDFTFSTVQTLSRENHLQKFSRTHFDYIIIDESHRTAAKTYKKILEYFTPKFLLGMTATPERLDGFDIFSQYDYNIAYEIRLHQALEEDMLCTFHYYGVRDISINGELLQEDETFEKLIDEERVNRIIEKANFYSCDSGIVRGLIFCSRKDEAVGLAEKLNSRGFKTIALTGESTEEERIKAIELLEEEDLNRKIDYIITVDIFNEGIDIPRVNQIIMLRPTQSAIIFVQQLGRGLRKAENKDYLTVIDFIGNYKNNFLVPIALYGDNTYNKETIRNYIGNGSNLIPGASTINFDRITKEVILKSINQSNLQTKRELVKDFINLQNKIGKTPTMMDFIHHGFRDPFQYVQEYKSYYGFLKTREQILIEEYPLEIKEIIDLFSFHIADGKRIEEIIILNEILTNGKIYKSKIKEIFFKDFGGNVSYATIASCIRNLNFQFIKKPKKIIKEEDGILFPDHDLSKLLTFSTAKSFIQDAINYASFIYKNQANSREFDKGFLLYNRYTRKDVCRILNWDEDETSTLYGYKVKNGTCPIFVNYKKGDDIESSIKYQDEFINSIEFKWMSRSRRKLDSKELQPIIGGTLRLSLFVRKNLDEPDFYYLGDVKVIKQSQTEQMDDNGQMQPIVQMILKLEKEVDIDIYNYLVSELSH